MDAEFTDLGNALQREVERCLALLGDLVHKEYNYQLLREQARRTLVPVHVLWSWWNDYRKQGAEGLRPTQWKLLDESAKKKVLTKYQQLSPLADQVEVTVKQVYALASQNGWSKRTAIRWFQRYRVGGLWGLAPGYNPEKAPATKRASPPRRALGTLDEAAFTTIQERLLLLGDELLRPGPVSRKQIEERAKEKAVSKSTLWDYRKDYFDYGLIGLAPQERSDKGQVHRISPRMVWIIEGLRHSKVKMSVRAVYEEACKRARALGEVEPSKWQVRMICAKLPEADLLLAQGDEKGFKNSYEISWDMNDANLRSMLIVYEIDHTPVDVLVKDERPERLRTPSGTIRPWLTLCIDRRSRLILAAIFAYERPNRHTVAAVIRGSVLLPHKKPYGGIPNEIWVDNGKELLSHHVLQLTQGLGIVLHPCARHQPQQKGIVERFFEVLNTRLWSRQSGYVGSNTTERLPAVKATLTLVELEAIFWRFVEEYHNEEHSRLQYEGRRYTPLAYWQEHCWAEAADPRALDVLLMEPEERTVQKTGIKIYSRLYWHTALADFVGQSVIVRSAPNYAATQLPPDDLEVFFANQWICTAFAVDSETGRAVTSREVASAKAEQRKKAHGRIKQQRDAVEQADKDIKALDAKPGKETPTSPPPAPSQSDGSTGHPPQESKRAPTFFERLAEQEENK